MCALEKKLRATQGQPAESEFLQQSLTMLRSWSGITASVDDWTITPFEIDLGPVIGSGGLYVHIPLS
jgi:hypothetical protein